VVLVVASQAAEGGQGVVYVVPVAGVVYDRLGLLYRRRGEAEGGGFQPLEGALEADLLEQAYGVSEDAASGPLGDDVQVV